MADPTLTPAQRLASYCCFFLSFGDPSAEPRVLLAAIMCALDDPNIVTRLITECDRVLAECSAAEIAFENSTGTWE